MKNSNIEILLTLWNNGLETMKKVIHDEVQLAISQQQIAKKEEEIKYLTRKETAQLLGISLPTLNDWTKKGLLKSYRISSRVRYIESEVHHAMESLRKYQHH